MYLSRIRFLAETDRLEMSLFVAVTTNSVSSWARLPVMVLASTPKTGTVILRGLSFSWMYRLVVCCLLLVVRAWLTNVINFVLSLYPTDNGSILFSCFGLCSQASTVRESEVRFSLSAARQCIIEDSNNNSVSYKFILQSSVLTILGEAVQVLNKGVHRFTGVLSSSIGPRLFNDNTAAGCKITIEGCFDFVKGSGCFVYA